MINKNDFIYLDIESRPYRVRKGDGQFHLYHFEGGQWAYKAGVALGNDDVLKAMLARALPADACLKYEHGLPFLPMSQMEMFNAMAPYHEKHLLTATAGELHTCIVELDPIDPNAGKVPIHELHVSFGYKKEIFVDAGVFRFN